MVPSRETFGLGMRVVPYVRCSNSLVDCRRCGLPALTSSLQTQKGPASTLRPALAITTAPTADDERSKDGRDAGRGAKARLLEPSGGLYLGRNHSQIGRFTGCRWEVDQGCGHVRPCTQANFDGNRILVRLGESYTRTRPPTSGALNCRSTGRQKFRNWLRRAC